ncbi:hypothetical protein JCM11251_002768 [Rhodosporidiobolus azoricus]
MTSKPDYHQQYPISSRTPATTTSSAASEAVEQGQGQPGVVEGAQLGQSLLQLLITLSFQQEPLGYSPTTTSNAAGMVTLNPFFASAQAHMVSFNGVANFAPLASHPAVQMATPLPFPAAEHPLPPVSSASSSVGSPLAASGAALPPPPPPPPYSAVVGHTPLNLSAGGVTTLSSPPNAPPHTAAPFFFVTPALYPQPQPHLASPTSPFAASSPFLPGAAGFSPFVAFGGQPPQGFVQQPHSGTVSVHPQQQQQPQMLTPWPPVPLRKIDDFLSHGGSAGTGVHDGSSPVGGAAGGGYLFPHPISLAQQQRHQQQQQQQSQQASGVFMPASSSPPPPSMPPYQPPPQQQPQHDPSSSTLTYPISSAGATTAAATTAFSSMSYQQGHQAAYSFPSSAQQMPTAAQVNAGSASVVAPAVQSVPPSAGHAPTHVPPIVNDDASNIGLEGGGGRRSEDRGKCAVDTCGAKVTCELSPCGCRLCREHLGWVLRGGIELPLPALDTSAGSSSTSTGGNNKKPQKTQKLFRCVACGKKSTSQVPSTMLPPSSTSTSIAPPAVPPSHPAPLSSTTRRADANALAFSIKYFSTGPAPALSSASPPPPLPTRTPSPASSPQMPQGYAAYTFGGYPMALSPLTDEGAFELAAGQQHGRQDSIYSTVSSLSSNFSSSPYMPYRQGGGAEGMVLYNYEAGLVENPEIASAVQSSPIRGLGLTLDGPIGYGARQGGGAGLLPAFDVEPAKRTTSAGRGGGGRGSEELQQAQEQVYPISSARTLAAEQAARQAQENAQLQQALAEAEGRSVPPHLKAKLAFSASPAAEGGAGLPSSRPSTALAVEEIVLTGLIGVDSPASPPLHPPTRPPRTPSPFQHASPSAHAGAPDRSSSISTPSTSATSTSSPYTPYTPHPIPVYTPPGQQPPLYHVPATAVNITPAIVLRAREQQQQLAQGGRTATAEPVLRAAKPYGSPTMPFPARGPPGPYRGPYATAPPAPHIGNEAVASGANAFSVASANPFAASIVAVSTSSSAAPASGDAASSPISTRRGSLASSVGGGGLGSVSTSPVRGSAPGAPFFARRGRPREPPSFQTSDGAAGGGGGEGNGEGGGSVADGAGGDKQEWRGLWPIVKVENIPFNTTMHDVLDWLPPGYLAAEQYVPMPIHLVLHRATGRTLPHCYLELASVEQATALIAMMDRTSLGDRTVRVKWERPGEMMRDFFSQEVFFQGPDVTRSPAAAPLPHLPPEGYKLPDVLLTTEDLRRIVAYCQQPFYFRERPYERAFYHIISLIAKFPWSCGKWDEELRDAMFQAARDVATKALSFDRDSPLFRDIIDRLVGVVLGCPGFTDAQKDEIHSLAPHVRPPAGITLAEVASASRPFSVPPSPPPPDLGPSFIGATASAAAVADVPGTLDASLNRSLAPPETLVTTSAPLEEQRPENDPVIAGGKTTLPPSPPYYRSIPRGGIGRGGGTTQRDKIMGEWVELGPPATATADASALQLSMDEVGPTPAEAAKVVMTRRGSAHVAKSPKAVGTSSLPSTTTLSLPYQPAPSAVSIPSQAVSASEATAVSPPATPPPSPNTTKGSVKAEKKPAIPQRREAPRGWASQD